MNDIKKEDKLDITIRVILIFISWLLLSAANLLPSFFMPPGYSWAMEEINCKGYEYPPNMYEKLCGNDGNLSVGIKGFSNNGLLYVNHNDSFYSYDFDNDGWDYNDKVKADSIIYYDSVYLGIQDNGYIRYNLDLKQFSKNYDWRKVYLKEDQSPDFKKIYQLMKKQENNNISAKELYSMVSLIQKNIVLGWDGNNLYITQDKSNGEKVLTRYAGGNEKDLQYLGSYKCYKNFVYLKNKIYFISEDRKSIQEITIETNSNSIAVFYTTNNDENLIDSLNVSAVSDDILTVWILSGESLVAFNDNENTNNEKLTPLKVVDKGTLDAIYCVNNYCYVNFYDVTATNYYYKGGKKNG